MTPVVDVLPTSQRTSAYRWELLALLWLAFFFNQADRQIFSVVLPLIRADLRLSDAELGLIASVLLWTYGLLVPVAGFVGDRFSRRRVIGFSLLLWSVATLGTGLCGTLLQFILLRGVTTGGGEAFYAPSANALLSEHHGQNRSFALALHQTAVYAGIILSGLIAGYVGEHYGWRNAFYLFGGFGVVLGGVVLVRLRHDQPAAGASQTPVGATARLLVRKPTVLLLTAAFGCMVFVNVGYLTWTPSFLADKFGLTLAQAGFSSLFYHHVGALLGVMLGGRLADRLARRAAVSRLWLQAAALLLGAPCIYWMGRSSSATATYAALFLFGVLRGVYDSNIFAALYEVVPARLRSSASGLMLMGAFLVGASAPYLLGVLKPRIGLEAGLSGLSGGYVLGGLLLAAAALFCFSRDYTPAPAPAA